MTTADWATGALVLAAYAIVQLAVLQGPRPYDPSIYFHTAVAFPDVDANLWSLRIGLVLPVRAAVLLFGPSEAALYAVPFAAGLVLAAAVYGTTLLLFHDRWAAAAAALVAVLNPNYLVNSSFIFPDTAATATFAAGFLFLVLGAMRRDERDWLPTVSVICAGVLLGWTYLIREFSPLLFPAVVVAVALFRYPLRRIVLLAGAALTTFSLELLYGLRRYGDPFVHVHELLDRRESPVPAPQAERIAHVQGQLDDLLETALVFPRLLLSWRVGWVFLLLVVIFVVALAWLRDRRLWVLAAWCFGFWAIMAVLGLGSLSSGRWILNITNIRYWYPVFPPLVMGAFGGVALLLRRRGHLRGLPVVHAVTTGLAALALVPGLVEFNRCAERDVWLNDPAGRWHDLRSWLASAEGRRYDLVWTDRSTQRLLPAYTSTTFGEPLWQGRAKTFVRSPRGIVPSTAPTNSVVLVNKDRFSSESRLRELRREWMPIFASDDGAMIVLARKPRGAGDAVRGKPAWWRLPEAAGKNDARGCGTNPYAPRR